MNELAELDGRFGWKFRVGCTLTAALGVMMVTSGCQPTATRFQIASYSEQAERKLFHANFEECAYAVGPGGNVDIVARSIASGDGEEVEDLTQVVHMRTVFRAVPGTTHADRTMINATVKYAILTASGGVCLEGAGFLFCTENRGRTVLTGELEQARLEEKLQVGALSELFEHVEITGGIRATRDRKKVVGILNELRRVFGPEPAYEPPLIRGDPI